MKTIEEAIISVLKENSFDVKAFVSKLQTIFGSTVKWKNLTTDGTEQAGKIGSRNEVIVVGILRSGGVSLVLNDFRDYDSTWIIAEKDFESFEEFESYCSKHKSAITEFINVAVEFTKDIKGITNDKDKSKKIYNHLENVYNKMK